MANSADHETENAARRQSTISLTRAKRSGKDNTMTVITKTRLGIFILALGVFLAACSSPSGHTTRPPHVKNYIPVFHPTAVVQVANSVIHDFDALNFVNECDYVIPTAKSACLSQANLAQTFMQSFKQNAPHITLTPDGVIVQGSKALAFFTGQLCQGTSCTTITHQQESQLKSQPFASLYAQVTKASQSSSSSSSSSGLFGPAIMPMVLIGGRWYIQYEGLS